MEKQRVLFLCTGNSCRSQMAEAFLRRYAGQYFEAYSAGLEPKPIHPYTIQVMDEIGFDISGQTSKGINVCLGKVLFKCLITVCAVLFANHPVMVGWQLDQRVDQLKPGSLDPGLTLLRARPNIH